MNAPAPARDRLTPGELSLWMLQGIAPEYGVANVALCLAFPQPLNWWPLREALLAVVDRHPALRMTFPLDGDAPVRWTRPPGEVEIDVDTAAATPDRLEEALREYAARPFALDKAPMLRLGLFTSGRDERSLCLVAHHLIIDGASLDLLLGEIMVHYFSFLNDGCPAVLPEPPAAAPALPSGADSRAYWRQRLRGYDSAGTRLPMARDVADPPTFASEEVRAALPVDAGAAVAVLRKRGRGTDASVLLAAYLLALRAQGAADDAVLGVMVSTRGGPLAREVGFQVATLPVRVTVDPAWTFAELTRCVTAELTAAVEHADVSFESLTREVSAGADPLWWRSGLVRQLFNYRFHPAEHDVLPGQLRDVSTGLSRFDLELTAERKAGDLLLRLVYSTEVHDRAFAAALLDRLVAALVAAAGDADLRIGDLDLRTPAERAVNDTAVEWTGPRSVPGAIEVAHAGAPDAPAIVDAARTVTYRELVAAAGRVAALLRDEGVRPGDVVAVAGPRGPELAAAVLGTWAAGAAYLPLDAEHPPQRLRHQLDDAGCRAVLDGHLLPAGCGDGRACVEVPLVGSVVEEPAPLPDAAPDSVAYLIYTSGSTGQPKGVRLTHGNLANVVAHFAGLLDAAPETAMLWLTTFAFDISALELYLPLTRGGRVVVAPDAARADAAALLALVDRARVTAVQATPTTWRLLAADPGDTLRGRTVLCGGEPLSPALARQLVDAGCRAYNVYGPTETTIWSTVAVLSADEPDRPSVGRPIANTRIGILGADGRWLPPGAPGELCLAGDGVALGYHDRPELTADRFRDDPLLGRYYRTGDVARLRPDGRIELLGRRDRQIKLRAHRIELGEVEAAIEEHPEVTAVSVVLRGDPTADGHLAAYIAAEARPGLAEDVWSYARERLPAYSLPGRIVVVDALPQTPNGKVDVNRLAALEPREPAPAGPAAADGLEDRLVDAWAEVLGRSGVAPDTNFFLTGGTSLLAVRLAVTASRISGTEVTMGMVFRAPTPAALAQMITTRAAS